MMMVMGRLVVNPGILLSISLARGRQIGDRRRRLLSSFGSHRTAPM